MLISEAEEYLEHYGKRGMRWGVRSAAKTSGSSPKGKQEKGKESSEHGSRVKKGKVAVASLLSTVGPVALTVVYAGVKLVQVQSKLQKFNEEQNAYNEAHGY